ncbi:MAG: 2-oxoglutarate dehydrogenase complex dihydrolipoyllysine-residue succinyltransferase [Gemmatimonadetes bacterium]|nr:2-oxoglutarate dehydrogenase complex dihydrolipoyllysine-residue succinyltransferase [Gemmatimonadota bacterium]
MSVQVEIPSMGESVSEVILLEWLKGDGERVEQDEPLCVLETDKANVELPSPASGALKHLQPTDTTLTIGAVVAEIDESAQAAAPAPASKPEPAAPKPEPTLSPAVRRLVEEHELDPTAIEGTGKDGRLTKKDVLAHLETLSAPEPAQPSPAPEPAQPPPVPKPAPPPEPESTPAPEPAQPAPAPASPDLTRREPMSRLRQRIAEHLVAAQHNAAMLTTFNEIDMSAVMQLRAKYKERFAQVHGSSLGLMSFFSRAAVLALGDFPAINAQIDDTHIVYHDFVNLGIAVSTERGLVVPVLHRADQMSIAQLESNIKRLALSARDNKLAMDELSGGTFTITNGGVFGSLLSTPILNAPQSGILGMHAIQERPVAVEGQVVVRPMMYVALSYDHRLVDGQQSVSFLVRLKELLEDPARLLLEV